MQGLDGICRVAVQDTLPSNTVLLGSDLGKAKLLQLMNDIKTSPSAVMAVTRSGAARNKIAAKMAESKHATEGATPLSFDDIPDDIAEPDIQVEETVDTPQPAQMHIDTHHSQQNSRWQLSR